MEANPFGCQTSKRSLDFLIGRKARCCLSHAHVLALLWMTVSPSVAPIALAGEIGWDGGPASNAPAAAPAALPSAANPLSVTPPSLAATPTPTNLVVGSVRQESVEGLPLDELKKRAQSGDAAEEYALGWCYANGVAVTRDDAEAAKWYRKAAEHGDLRAQERMGFFCHFGRGVHQDDAEAAGWFRKAAEHGNADAQCGLGMLYYYGQGVAQDYAEAAKWLRRAAEQRGAMEALAQDLLAECYSNGHGVAQDHVEAVKWYRKAAERGDDTAQFALAFSYDAGQGVTQDYIEAVKWARKAAEQGNGKAQFTLGWHYYVGNGVTQDYVEAYKWLNLAAANTGQWGKLEAKGQSVAAEYRNEVAGLMTPEQVAEGQRRASQFVPRREGATAANQGARPTFAETPRGSGTGFFVAYGYVVTSYHVVSDASAIKVVVNGNGRKAKLVNADPANDLALLWAPGTVSEIAQEHAKPDLPPSGALNVTAVSRILPILGSRDVHLGDSVFTVGFPNTEVQGVEPKLTRGEINSLAGAQDDLRFFQMSAAVQPGNSGGPLVDTRGNVIGVVEARLDDMVALQTSGALPQNVNYALKSSFLSAFLDSAPELAGRLKESHIEKDRPFNDVVNEVRNATVMVLVY